RSRHDTVRCTGGQSPATVSDWLVAVLQLNPTVLRQALYRDVETGHGLESRHERGMQRSRRLDDVAQDAIDAKADDRAPLVRLEVKIGRALPQRLQQQRVDHADDR